MAKILVIQGAGMDARGKTMVEVFGPETLDEINAMVQAHAVEIGVEVEIIQSNDAQTVVVAIERADAIDAIVINPGGFTAADTGIPAAITARGVPAVEVHASNPAVRGVQSVIAPVCRGAICGFGYFGYRLALMALDEMTS